MTFAHATKDQMKVWKSAQIQYKDDPERKVNQVMLTVAAPDGLELAYLTATDGYQLMKRNISIDEDSTFKEYTSAIPRPTIEKAEKAMKQGDRAYFGENRITLKSPIRDDNGDVIDYKTFAEFPYIEQLDMFSDFESALETAIKDKVTSQVVTIDAKVLKTIVEQLRSDDNRVYVQFTLRGSLDAVTMQAFVDDETKEITAAVMPIKNH